MPNEKKVDADPAFDPQVILRKIQNQSAECDRLAADAAKQKEAFASAKAAYDSAVEELRSYCRKPAMPLFGEDERDWRNCPIIELGLSDDLTQKIIESCGETMGKLSEWLNAGNNFAGIKGVGELKAEKIEHAMDAFWAKHPEINRENPTEGDEPKQP